MKHHYEDDEGIEARSAGARAGCLIFQQKNTDSRFPYLASRTKKNPPKADFLLLLCFLENLAFSSFRIVFFQ
jgi:hypothetical protein